MHQEPDSIPIGRSLGRAHKFLHALGDREMAPLGASVTDYILLFQIDNAPEPGLSQTEIARFSNMGGPALVRHLDRMERDGLVQRARDAADRRIMRVTLSPAGQARLVQLQAVISATDQKVRALLTREEADVLQVALDKVFEFALNELYASTPPSAPPTTRPASRSTR